jgi:hypothetical protein
MRQKTYRRPGRLTRAFPAGCPVALSAKRMSRWPRWLWSTQRTSSGSSANCRGGRSGGLQCQRRLYLTGQVGRGTSLSCTTREAHGPVGSQAASRHLFAGPPSAPPRSHPQWDGSLCLLGAPKPAPPPRLTQADARMSRENAPRKEQCGTSAGLCSQGLNTAGRHVTRTTPRTSDVSPHQHSGTGIGARSSHESDLSGLARPSTSLRTACSEWTAVGTFWRLFEPSTRPKSCRPVRMTSLEGLKGALAVDDVHPRGLLGESEHRVGRTLE